MRIIPGLTLSLTLIVFANAGFLDLEVVPKTDPDPVVPDLPPKEYPPSHPINNLPPAQAPNEQPGENESERDIGETLSNILDAITSVISLAAGTSTITSTISLPTAAHPCLSAQNLFNSCASLASSSYARAPSTQVCIAPLTCVHEPSGPATATAKIQSSCLCHQPTSTSAPGLLFDEYLGSCNNYIQNQTQLATRSGLKIGTAFCTSAPTEAAVLSTPAAPLAASTTPPQTPFTGAATALSPVMFGGSWYAVWWTVVVLVGSGWAARS